MPFAKSLQKVYISCAERIWSLNGLCKLALAGNLLTVPPVTCRFAMACGKKDNLKLTLKSSLVAEIQKILAVLVPACTAILKMVYKAALLSDIGNSFWKTAGISLQSINNHPEYGNSMFQISGHFFIMYGFILYLGAFFYLLFSFVVDCFF